MYITEYMSHITVGKQEYHAFASKPRDAAVKFHLMVFGHYRQLFGRSAARYLKRAPALSLSLGRPALRATQTKEMQFPKQSVTAQT